jgi:hypothetical protein
VDRGGAADPLRRRRPAEAQDLFQALFSPDFDFVYDTELTLTAAEAFTSRRGNCLSFTSMFVAMARSAGIPTFLMSVRRDPEVDRDGSLVVVNRHVVAGYRGASSEVHIFDFYVTTTEPYIQRRTIDDVTATAMFHTNLGGDAIRRGDLGAVRNLGIATTLAPDWAPGWINLEWRTTGGARSRLPSRTTSGRSTPSREPVGLGTWRSSTATRAASARPRMRCARPPATTNPFT